MLNPGQNTKNDLENGYRCGRKKVMRYAHSLYKVQCFIKISGTDKTDNLTCEIIYDNFTCENYRFSNNHQS